MFSLFLLHRKVQNYCALGKVEFYFPKSGKVEFFTVKKKTAPFCQIGKKLSFFPEFGKEGFYFPESGKVEFLLLDLPVRKNREQLIVVWSQHRSYLFLIFSCFHENNNHKTRFFKHE